jgi:hypothetical protein
MLHEARGGGGEDGLPACSQLLGPIRPGDPAGRSSLVERGQNAFEIDRSVAVVSHHEDDGLAFDDGAHAWIGTERSALVDKDPGRAQCKRTEDANDEPDLHGPRVAPRREGMGPAASGAMLHERRADRVQEPERGTREEQTSQGSAQGESEPLHDRAPQEARRLLIAITHGP